MRRTHLTLAAVALLPLLVGCTSPADTNTTTPETTQSAPTSSEHTTSPSVTIESGWAKAASDMSGVFGTVHNHTDTDLTITNLSSESAESVELHEVTADGVMQAITDPVSIPAAGTLELAPGANHIMLMDMPTPLLAGDTVTVTVSFSDGTSAPLDVLVKEYGGANESYDDLTHSEHDGH